MHISGKTNNLLWDWLLVFNTSLSVPYFVFGIGYAICTLIRFVIRIFDVVFVAKANFTLVLWRSWKTNIFRFKNVTVCFITNFIVFFVLWKSFCTFPLLTIVDYDIACIVHSCVYSDWLLDCISISARGWLPNHAYSMVDD